MLQLIFGYHFMLVFVTYCGVIRYMVEGQQAIQQKAKSPPPLRRDNKKIIDVVGNASVAVSWADSYSIGNRCYCQSTFDHGIGKIRVNTPVGKKSIRTICKLLGSGPGSTGRPLYNDIQCGNGPSYSDGSGNDERTCPGRVEYGKRGCKYIGPKWKFDHVIKELKKHHVSNATMLASTALCGVGS